MLTAQEDGEVSDSEEEGPEAREEELALLALQSTGWDRRGPEPEKKEKPELKEEKKEKEDGKEGKKEAEKDGAASQWAFPKQKVTFIPRRRKEKEKEVPVALVSYGEESEDEEKENGSLADQRERSRDGERVPEGKGKERREGGAEPAAKRRAVAVGESEAEARVTGFLQDLRAMLEFTWLPCLDAGTGSVYYWDMLSNEVTWSAPTLGPAPAGHTKTALTNKFDSLAQHCFRLEEAPLPPAEQLEVAAVRGSLEARRLDWEEGHLPPAYVWARLGEAGARLNALEERTEVPSGWERRLDPHRGQAYYLHPATRLRQWAYPRPPEDPAAAAAAAAAAAPAPAPAAPAAPATSATSAAAVLTPTSGPSQGSAAGAGGEKVQAQQALLYARHAARRLAIKKPATK